MSQGTTCSEGEVAQLAPRTGRSRTLVLVRAAPCGCACCALHSTGGCLSRGPRERPSAGAVASASPGLVCSSQLTVTLSLGGVWPSLPKNSRSPTESSNSKNGN